jgi:hypothetical protein
MKESTTAVVRGGHTEIGNADFGLETAASMARTHTLIPHADSFRGSQAPVPQAPRSTRRQTPHPRCCSDTAPIAATAHAPGRHPQDKKQHDHSGRQQFVRSHRRSMRSRFSHSHGEQIHRGGQEAGPFVRAPLAPYAGADTERSRTVSRRSELRSRPAFRDEQSHPCNRLQLQDARIQHRGAKRGRRCVLWSHMSLLSLA